MTPSLETAFFAFLGGVLPALLWLAFWHRQDRARPEPRRLVALAFLSGMAAVLLVIPLERAAAAAVTGPLLIALWSVIEEVAKFGAAYAAVLRRREMDEPVDAVVYLITVALGFAALENALFLLGPIGSGSIVESVVTGNFRFFGATLLHTLASATVGVAMALSFYRREWFRRIAVFWGLILAVALHALFNLSILKSNGTGTLLVFLFVWLGIIAILLLFEKVKRIRAPRSFVR